MFFKTVPQCHETNVNNNYYLECDIHFKEYAELSTKAVGNRPEKYLEINDQYLILPPFLLKLLNPFSLKSGKLPLSYVVCDGVLCLTVVYKVKNVFDWIAWRDEKQ